MVGSFLYILSISHHALHTSFIHFTVDEHLGRFQFGVTMNNAVLKIFAHVIWCTYVSIFVRCTLRSKIMESWGVCSD